MLVAGLVVLTFVPMRVLHPVRVKRLRPITLGLIAVWSALALYTLAMNFEEGGSCSGGVALLFGLFDELIDRCARAYIQQV